MANFDVKRFETKEAVVPMMYMGKSFEVNVPEWVQAAEEKPIPEYWETAQAQFESALKCKVHWDDLLENFE